VKPRRSSRLTSCAAMSLITRTTRVGCVGDDLIFMNTGQSPVSGGHGAYWRYERYLRRCEPSLGILA
jgi:hypothetical protein